MLLSHAGVEFEDCCITPERFKENKDAGLYPYTGNLPIWEEDGVKYCQSISIMRMLGIRHGYYTTDPDEAWMIDSTVDFIANGCMQGLYPLIMGQKFDDKEAVAAFLEQWDKMGKLLDARLGEHGKQYIAGTDRMSIADFVVSSHYFGLIYNDDGAVQGKLKQQVLNVIAETPHLKRYLENTMAEELEGYLETRQKYPF